MNAEKIPCEILYRPDDPKYAESIRLFQGVPTVAVTRGGRVYVGWYAGGTREPHIENYVILAYSDDGGKTFTRPLLIIPSSKERLVHASDPQLWMDTDGKLHLFWVQNNVEKEPPVKPTYGPAQSATCVDGYMFSDFTHATWEMICDDPDAADPTFNEPRMFTRGFLRTKPTVLKNGDIIYCAYDQWTDRYGYSVSSDGGKTAKRFYGAEKMWTYFDETMAYECKDGTVRMFARAVKTGVLAETDSTDGGKTWSETKKSGIYSPNTRFYISRTPSGRILLVVNDHDKIRRNMTAFLSDDDGATFPYRMMLDTRDDVSYPDADFYDGKIYVVYDCERTGAKEIWLAVFTEDDVINGREPEKILISKP